MFDIIRIFVTDNDEKQFYLTKSVMNVISIGSELYVKQNQISTPNEVSIINNYLI